LPSFSVGLGERLEVAIDPTFHRQEPIVSASEPGTS
jgi:hypothetical protein